MFPTSKKLASLFVILIILVSFYMGIVQIVNALEPGGFLKSLAAKSLRNTNSASQFVVGDVLTVEAEAGLANEYDLQIYQNSSLVFERKGHIYESLVKVCVPLDPPIFNAGSDYSACLYVFIYNYPIAGVYFMDHVNWVFEIEGTETRLSLNGDYDNVLRNLCLCANLTDVDGYPVVNETVDFSLQFNGRQRYTDGCFPIGSAVTNAGGLAILSLALNVLSGEYLVNAHHEGNENFGESEDRISIEILPGLTYEEFSSLSQLQTCSASRFSLASEGDVYITVSSSSPYACLPMSATGRYVAPSPPDPEAFPYWMLFYCDYTNHTGCISASELSEVGYCIYETTLVWSPYAAGSHRLIAGVVYGDMYSIYNAMINGTGLIGSGDVNLDIQRCPSNIIFHFPEVAYDDALPVDAVFSRPRLYEAKNTSGFVATTLAPQLLYDNKIYAIDEPVESVPIQFYVNDTLMETAPTDEDGIGSILLHLNFSMVNFELRIKAGASNSSLYEEEIVESDVAFTRVTVHGVTQGASDLFKLNYTIRGHGNGTIYVGTENWVDVDVRLFGLPVWNAPVSVLIGKTVKRDCTNSSGWVSVPEGSTSLKISCLYDIQSSSAYAACDVVKDGIVNMMDIYAVNRAFMSRPGNPNWNWRADVNLDLIVNMVDSYKCVSNFMKSVSYTEIVDYSVVKLVFYRNGQWEEKWLDRSGCVSIPSGASKFWLTIGDEQIGAVVEFFKNILHRDICTNNVGIGKVAWVPTEIGSTDTIDEGLPPYFLLVWLPSSFQTLRTGLTDVTTLGALSSFVSVVNVEKRPIDLSVDYMPSEPTRDDTITIFVNCFDLGFNKPAAEFDIYFFIYGLNKSNGAEICIFAEGDCTNSSGVATFSFIPAAYSEEYDLFLWFYVFAVSLETDYTSYSEAFVLLDVRYPTRLEFLGGDVINAKVDEEQCLSCRLVRADNGDPVKNRSIRVYMNNTPVEIYINGTSYDVMYTDENGVCAFKVAAYEEGLYFFKLQFSWGEGFADVDYQYCDNATFVIVAAVQPVFVFFDVQPKEFSPNTTVTLGATVYNATSNLPLMNPLTGFVVRFYSCDENGVATLIGERSTDANGFASITWRYPESGVYVFYVSVVTGQQLISSPVMLTVGKGTELTLNVQAPNADFDYPVSGKLLSGGVPVAGKQVGIKVNGTLVAVVETAEDGSYDVTLNLKPVDNKPTDYQVEAVFYGDNALNLTLTDTTPNGTQYAVCTTLQYFGYKPASNSTWLTVKPQSTEKMTQTKTPEQMQAEAEQSGWLSIYHEFSWWYPWYRLHFVGTHGGESMIDIGIALLPLVDCASLNTLFNANIDTQITDLPGILLTGMILGEAAIWLAGNAGPFVFAIFVGGWILIKLLLFQYAWNSAEKLWESLIANFISTVISAFNALAQFLPEAMYALASGVANMKNWAFAFIYKCIMIPINIYLIMAAWDRLCALGAV